MNKDEYEEVMKSLKGEQDFLWEMSNWESFVEKYKENDKDSYDTYLRDKCKDDNN